MIFLRKYGVHIIGLLIFLGTLSLPNALSWQQTQFLAIFFWVVFYWLFSSIPLYAVGLLGVSLSAIFELAPASQIFSSFGHPIIFLFLGGFLLAKAFAHSQLDKRMSLFLLTRRIIKGSIARLIFAMMALTCILTMWISNTATTAMMLPIILGTLQSLKINDKKTISLILLSIAYSASIGGIATPIGSTPNLIAIGMLERLSNIQVSFLEWMLYCFPLAIIFLSALYIIIYHQLKMENIKFENDYLMKQFRSLPPISLAEKYTFSLFIVTVFLWILPSIFKLFDYKPPFDLNSGAVVMLTASMLFLVPFSKQQKLLQSHHIKTIDWSSLLLFGCGLALGQLLFELGLAKIAGDTLISYVSELPLFLILLLIFSFVIFSTELTSNTASANILLPIMISMAPQLNFNPFYLSLGIAIACSMAFMLPVATPPNAIVYGSEKIDKKQMLTLGLKLNIIISFLLAGLIYCYNFFKL